MFRRIKKLFGFSSRGAYFPNNEVAPADGSVLSSSSQKLSKKQQKKLEAEQQKEAEKSFQKKDIEVVHDSLQKSNGLVIGGEETISNFQKADSMSYGEPSDKSRQFTSSRSSDAVPSLNAEASSNASLAGSVCVSMPKKDSYESEYSTDTTQEDENDVKIELCNEMAVDVPHSSGKSSLCVNMPATPLSTEDEMENPRPTPVSPKEEDDMERQWREMNEQLNDILSKPAPFQVSTTRLPPMKMLEQAPIDREMSIEEFEGHNSVTEILNESHEKTLSSPEQKHLRSFGY